MEEACFMHFSSLTPNAAEPEFIVCNYRFMLLIMEKEKEKERNVHEHADPAPVPPIFPKAST